MSALSARSLTVLALGLLAGCGSSSGAIVFVDSGLEAPPDEVIPVGEEDTGQVPGLCLNEFMPANAGSYPLDNGALPDWVEVHNLEDHDVDLDGWFLSDDLDNPRKWALSGEIDGGAFLVLTGGDEGEDFDFGLDSDGGTVMLTDAWGGGSRIDYGEIQDDFSVARGTDCCTGAACLDFSWGGTPGESNVEG